MGPSADSGPGCKIPLPGNPEPILRRRGFHHQVKVVGHEAAGADLPTGLLAGVAQGGEKALVVLVVRPKVLPPVAPMPDVAEGARVLDS